MNDFPQFLSVVADILTIIALIIGATFGVFVSVQYAPFVKLRIIPKWMGEGNDSDRVILRLEIENVSRVRINNQHIYLQVLEYKLPDNPSVVISEWVPFVEGRYQKPGLKEPPEVPVEWKEPVPILTTTETIYPGETLVIERSYGFSKNSFLKVGLQLKAAPANLKFVQRIIEKLNWANQWTTTAIIFRE